MPSANRPGTASANFDASLGVPATAALLSWPPARLAHSTGPAAVPGTGSRINSPTGVRRSAHSRPLAVRRPSRVWQPHMRGR